MGKFQDLTGMKFGKLTVIKQGEDHVTSGGRKQITWACRCDCGNTITVIGQSLRGGHVRSCGCIKTPDMTGMKFGKLTVIERAENRIYRNGEKKGVWKCLCDCGNYRYVTTHQLKRWENPNCGCESGQNRDEYGHIVKGKPIIDHTGKRYGMLTVLGLDKIEDKISWWFVRCDCGTVKSVRGNTLKTLKSCGCQKREQDLINIGVTDFNHHELSNHPVYSIWSGMKTRCENPKSMGYKDYGGRGIKICEEWLDFRNFVGWAEDTGFEPGKDLSIERIDVNGDYCPENCIWIERKYQARNCRNTIRLSIGGESKPLVEWSELYGIDYKTVSGRYKSGKRKLEDLFYKGNLQNRNAQRIDIFGEKLTFSEAGEKYGVRKETIWARYKRGIRDEKLLISKDKVLRKQLKES